MKLAALGTFRMYDAETKALLAEGRMTGYTYKDGYNKVNVKMIQPKKCPHCGGELK